MQDACNSVTHLLYKNCLIPVESFFTPDKKYWVDFSMLHQEKKCVIFLFREINILKVINRFLFVLVSSFLIRKGLWIPLASCITKIAAQLSVLLVMRNAYGWLDPFTVIDWWARRCLMSVVWRTVSLLGFSRWQQKRGTF